MEKKTLIHVLLAAATVGCVQTRPSRNGVFNENQYVRKDFLIRPGAANADGTTQPDNGWFMKATVTAVSTPNSLGGFGIDINPGISNFEENYVRFEVTEDHLNLVNLREFTPGDTQYRTEEVVNSWSITNVDLKYQVNLDGENTNFYQENQELDWQVRQWVKVKFAKNDLSDVAPLGPWTNAFLGKCADLGNASATLVPDSFLVDEQNDYFQWKVRVTVPLRWDDATCVQSYGVLGEHAAQIGKFNGTFDLMYSFVRALPLAKDPKNPQPGEDSYIPLEVSEKDPIRHKYAPIQIVTAVRDTDTGLVAGRQLVVRHDPVKGSCSGLPNCSGTDIVYYFAPGFPDGTNGMPNYKNIWRCVPGDASCNDALTIKTKTNKLLDDAYKARCGSTISPACPGKAVHVDFRDADDPRDAPMDAMGKAMLPRQYGDIRYNMLVWISDRDTDGFFGETVPFADPRTGRQLSVNIAFSEEPYFSIKEKYTQQIDAYLVTVGASSDVNSSDPWPDLGPCMDGDTAPIVPDTLASNHNGNSSLYAKMQQYLQKPADQYGNLGPQDFVVNHTLEADGGKDFERAYYALLPYEIYADPDSNPFVIREGGGGVYGPTNMWSLLQQEAQFQELAAFIDHGGAPYQDVTGPNGLQNATNFLNQWRDLTRAHTKLEYAKRFLHAAQMRYEDAGDDNSFYQVAASAGRRCVNGKWQTKEQWVDATIQAFWTNVMYHEFGHSMGLEHNFMASVDKPNFPHYTDGAGRDHVAMYQNSVMEYASAVGDVAYHPGWGPYDEGAITWIYANNAPSTKTITCTMDNDPACGPNGVCGKADPNDPKMTRTCSSTAITGMLNPTTPWNDPHGFQDDGVTEKSFLMCWEPHELYTPLCRTYDLGTTPSQIIANQIDSYEWQYQWRNFRSYRKFWDESAYANAPAGLIVDMRRFLSMWVFDWTTGALADDFRRLGIKNPNSDGSDLEYYTSLTNKLEDDISAANQMVAAFHKAVIQQSSGERPYRTIYDKFYGDVTQQGIILDKLFAMQGWVALWPTDNYDPNVAGGYISSYEGIGDASFNYVSADAVTSMIGGQYDVYPYFVPLAVAQFAQDTHSVNFGNPQMRDWIGGHVFTRLQDFLDYFRDIAVQNNFPGCTDIATCAYDPRPLSDTHNEFFGPDKRQWIWAYVPDRNTWVAVQKERNTASYIIMRNYTDDVVFQQDDGAFPGGAYSNLLPVKYFLDSFNYYN